MLDVRVCVYKGKAMEYTSGSIAVRCAIGMCAPVYLPRALAQVLLQACLKVCWAGNQVDVFEHT